jgi:hypothetical protein
MATIYRLRIVCVVSFRVGVIVIPLDALSQMGSGSPNERRETLQWNTPNFVNSGIVYFGVPLLP